MPAPGTIVNYIGAEMTKKGSLVNIGRHPVMEALTTGQAIDKVMVDRMAFPGDIIDKCKQQGVPVQKVKRGKGGIDSK